MKAFFVLLLVSPLTAFSLLNPTHLKCDSTVPFSVKHGKKVKTYAPGFHILKIKDVPVLSIGAAPTLAKFYPQFGLHHVLLKNKNEMAVATDTYRFWSLRQKRDGKTIINCEVKGE